MTKRIRFGGPLLPQLPPGGPRASTWYMTRAADGREKQVRANPGDEVDASAVMRERVNANGQPELYEAADWYVRVGYATWIEDEVITPEGEALTGDEGKE